MNILRKEVVGVDEKLPILGGSEITYVNFDNAASTPPLKRVLNKINVFMKFYSSIHRGTGFKSRLSSHYYEKSREKAGEFVDYDQDAHTVIFGKNATEAINKLSYRLKMPKDAVIILSQMEHHSNDLPWRDKAKVVHAPVNRIDGTLKIKELKKLIDSYKGKLFMVSITGASNVTGILNPIYDIAEMVHKTGAYFMVDGAQLIPHKKISLGKAGDIHAIDFLSFSAHKMYAPFGTGVLIARKDLLKKGEGPEYSGGGTVKLVTFDDVSWDEVPFIDEAGSPNVVGCIALSEAINFFNETGYEVIDSVEKRLTHKLMLKLLNIPDIKIYGKEDPEELDNRLGVVLFNIKNLPHALVASILAYDFGIGVRNGCFCAHPYIKVLLGIKGEAEKKLIKEILTDDRSNIPGAVRVSFGFYNEEEELDRLIDALHIIINNKKKYLGRYFIEKKTGEYFPINYQDQFEKYFKL